MGVDEQVARNTAFFYGDSDVSRGFRHKGFGFRKKNVSEAFAAHVKTHPALLFRNQPNPEGRCFERHKRFVEEMKDDEFRQMTLPMPMAHDYPGKTEGGAKDYMLLSPWQFLNTITDTPSTNVAATFKLYSDRVLEWPEAGHPWFQGGQPVRNSPRCSMYMHWYNPSAPPDSRHVSLVLDVDGKCCMTPEQKKNKDADAGNAVKRLFEAYTEQSAPRLLIISSILKEEIRALQRKRASFGVVAQDQRMEAVVERIRVGGDFQGHRTGGELHGKQSHPQVGGRIQRVVRRRRLRYENVRHGIRQVHGLRQTRLQEPVGDEVLWKNSRTSVAPDPAP